MADNAQKTPFVKTMNNWLDQQSKSAQQLLGKALPAQVMSIDSTGTIVTVQFLIQSGFNLPTVTCAVGYPPYIRFPLKAGDRGLVVSADYYMGGVTGLGGGVAELIPQANLSTLIFFATGNTGLTPTDNGNASVLYGPDGAILRDFGNNGPGTGGSQVRIEIDGKGNVQIYGALSLSTDVHGLGSRTTWKGGENFLVENYVTGATVTTVNLPFHPPQIPPPAT